MAAFLGMRGTGDWVTNQMPENWREAMLYLYPNGSMPLTAIQSKMKKEKVDSPIFHWWTKNLPDQAGAITGTYTDSILSTAYVSGGVAGDVLYVKMAETSCKQFRIGHQILLKDESDPTVDVVAKVTGRALNGASSYIQVKLLEADDNSGYGNTIANVDRVLIIGNINSEGAAMPSAISYDPVEYYNYTQIFRTPLNITRTARLTRLRTGDTYKEMKREALELQGIEMEKSALFGIRTSSTGDNGKPERTSQGLIPYIKENNPSCVSDFTLNATYHGKNWTDDGGGGTFLDYYLEILFRYGRQEKLAVCGSGALLGLNKLAEAGSHFTMTSTTKSYGINVTEWVTPFGVIHLKTHPLFSIESSLRYAMVIFEPENMAYKYISDTQFYGEGDAKQAAAGTQGGRIDGTSEEFLTECGYEFHHPYTAGFLTGIGQNHSS